MSKILKVVRFPARKLWNYTKALNTLLEYPMGIKDSAQKSFEDVKCWFQSNSDHQ